MVQENSKWPSLEYSVSGHCGGGHRMHLTQVKDLRLGLGSGANASTLHIAPNVTRAERRALGQQHLDTFVGGAGSSLTWVFYCACVCCAHYCMCSVCGCLCEHLSLSLSSLCMTFTHEGGWVFV